MDVLFFEFLHVCLFNMLSINLKENKTSHKITASYLYLFVKADGTKYHTHTEWLKQPKLIVSQFWSLEVQDEGVGAIGSM